MAQDPAGKPPKISACVAPATALVFRVVACSQKGTSPSDLVWAQYIQGGATLVYDSYIYNASNPIYKCGYSIYNWVHNPLY